MPIYEYTCSDCELTFELMRPISEADKEAPCPHCHNQARRIMSACVALSRNSSGETSRVSGTGTSCATCGASSCATCGH
ncbi:MAG TPA: zinc ribbon domain-containing protein [Dehalococcoidia bacterium]|nr:zinc ribbon domain-containing protein [Dehalococcoidia bacterium]